VPSAWKNYQEEVAGFFRSIGLNATVEKEIQGVRGTHRVDVHVMGSYMGIAFEWIVECKQWKTNVPKEKVMALSAIVQDVGADRGFLLSEKGFQSGAIAASQKSNIALTSLGDLADSVGDRFIESRIAGFLFRIGRLRTRLIELANTVREATPSDGGLMWFKWKDQNVPNMIGALSILEFVIGSSSKAKFPVRYVDSAGEPLSASSQEDLFAGADRTIGEIERSQFLRCEDHDAKRC
jgi:hypothetical protein